MCCRKEIPTIAATVPTTCILCEAGTSSPTSAADCTPCPAGTYSSISAAECTPCPAGTYSSASAAECTLCPSNSFTTGALRDSPAVCWCNAGYSGDETALSSPSSCVACTVGKYKKTRANKSCDFCEIAQSRFSANEGVEDCQTCDRGKIGQTTSTCGFCAVGMFWQTNYIHAHSVRVMVQGTDRSFSGREKGCFLARAT